MAERKETISYQQFADRLGIMPQSVNATLRPIHRFCDGHGLPSITARFLSQAGTPGGDLPVAGITEHYRERVFAEDWLNYVPPRAEELRALL